MTHKYKFFLFLYLYSCQISPNIDIKTDKGDNNRINNKVNNRINKAVHKKNKIKFKDIQVKTSGFKKNYETIQNKIKVGLKKNNFQKKIYDKTIKRENFYFILSPGLGSEKNSMDILKNRLEKFGEVTTCNRQSYDVEPILIQAQRNEPKFSEILKKNKNSIVFIGHSLGGLINIETLCSVLKKNPEFKKKIIKENIKIILIFLGSPLEGSIIGKKLPLSFLKLTGIDINNSAFKELLLTDEIKIRTKKNLDYLYKNLNKNIKVLPIVTESKFISEVTNLLFKHRYILFFLKKIKLLDIKSIDNFFSKLRNIKKNDGIVSIESQRGENVIEKDMLLKKNILCIKNHCHVNFNRYIPTIFKNKLSKEISILDSKIVFENITSALNLVTPFVI